MIEELLFFMGLKDEKRTGQQLYSIKDPDSIAGHSWSVAILTLVFGEDMDIDMEKALKIAVVHDLAEAETGDIATRAGQENKVSDEEKEVKERKVMEKFSEDLGLDFKSLWQAYEGGKSAEARFVKDMDKIERCITALKNEKEENYSPEDNEEMPYENLDEFFLTCEGKFRTEKGRELFKKIRGEYRKVKEG